MALIIQRYIEALALDGVKLGPDSAFLITRRAPTAKLPSKFVNSPLGAHELRKVPQKIAEFLGLNEPERYTGHCFRR